MSGATRCVAVLTMQLGLTDGCAPRKKLEGRSTQRRESGKYALWAKLVAQRDSGHCIEVGISPEDFNALINQTAVDGRGIGKEHHQRLKVASEPVSDLTIAMLDDPLERNILCAEFRRTINDVRAVMPTHLRHAGIIGAQKDAPHLSRVRRGHYGVSHERPAQQGESVPPRERLIFSAPANECSYHGGLTTVQLISFSYPNSTRNFPQTSLNRCTCLSVR